MAIKINLMPEAQKKGWQLPQGGNLRLYSIAFLLFAVSLFAFLVVYAYKLYIFPKKLSGLEKQSSDLTLMISNSFSPELLSAAQKAKSAKELLIGHMYWSKYFEIIESFTLKNIYFDQFSLGRGLKDATAIRADISGHADSAEILSKQVMIFMNNKEFSNVKFDGGTIDKDGFIRFAISVEVAQSFLKEQNIK